MTLMKAHVYTHSPRNRTHGVACRATCGEPQSHSGGRKGEGKAWSKPFLGDFNGMNGQVGVGVLSEFRIGEFESD